MKLLSSSPIVTSLLVTAAYAREARIDFLRHDAPQASTRHVNSHTLSPAAARMVVAEQIGVSEYHPVSLISPVDVAGLNDFYERSSVLFQDSSSLDRRKALIVLQDVDRTQGGSRRVCSTKGSCLCALHSAPYLIY